MRDTFRILYIEHIAEIGGGQTGLLGLIRTIDRARFTPMVTCVSHGELYDLITSLDVHVEIVDIRGVLRKNPVHTIANIRGLYEIIRDREIDLIHANSLKAHLMVSLPALLRRVPVIWHCRVTSDHGKLLDFLGCLRAKLIIVPSAFLSRRFDWARLCRKEVVVLQNAVDIEVFRGDRAASDLRGELGIEQGAFVVGALGRLEEEKGFHYLIEAAPEIARHVPGVRFLIVGTGPSGSSPYVEGLTKMANESPVSSTITFTGYRRDVRECIAAMDVVVVPSLREAFGRVALEAMAMEKPVVASAVGGLPELVDDGVTGLLVPANDPGALAGAVQRLYDSPLMREDMGRAGRRRAEDTFGLDVHVRQLERVYEKVIKGSCPHEALDGDNGRQDA